MTTSAPDIRKGLGRAAAARLLEAAGLPVSDLPEGFLPDFFYAGPAAEPVGLVGLELAGQYALLRSLAVVPGSRSRGTGMALVECAERHAKSRDIRDIFLLTTTAEGFFARLGYARVDRGEAPLEIRRTREFAEICPSGSALMHKRLV